MHAVERLRRLPAFPTHFWSLAIRAVESFHRPEVLGPVVQIRCLVLLLVAHDAFLSRVRPKRFPGPPQRPVRTLIAPRDPRALAQAIKGLAADPERRSAIVRNAREHVEKNFDIRRVVPLIEDFYHCI